MPPTWIGLTLAFASALVTNTAYSLEHDAPAALPPLSPRRPFRSAEFLLRDRRWLAAFAAATTGWLMYVAALRLAPLALASAGGGGVWGSPSWRSRRRAGIRPGSRGASSSPSSWRWPG